MYMHVFAHSMNFINIYVCNELALCGTIFCVSGFIGRNLLSTDWLHSIKTFTTIIKKSLSIKCRRICILHKFEFAILRSVQRQEVRKQVFQCLKNSFECRMILHTHYRISKIVLMFFKHFRCIRWSGDVTLANVQSKENSRHAQSLIG